jgi:hypothetical protein
MATSRTSPAMTAITVPFASLGAAEAIAAARISIMANFVVILMVRASSGICQRRLSAC